ncbi:hypothetical protein DQT32_03645 [Salmonella enterica subsp. enterica serovar Braenderup]|nr:hypothetical protein [Salmonella enterica subsp. enterica serovar Braenderup]
MTIAEIQKVLKSSFKNGFYLRRSSFVHLEVFVNKEGNVFHVIKDENGNIVKVQKTQFYPSEHLAEDWEIVL